MSQSSPGFTRGQIPTADDWNSYFSVKQDALGNGSVSASMLAPGAAATNIGVDASYLAGRPLTGRRPLSLDDSTGGYAIGDLWKSPIGIHKATSVSPGAAVWPLVSSSYVAPLDAVPGSLCAYGLRKLSTAYTGYCMSVTRASDSTSINIGFLGDGSWDSSTFNTFVRGTTLSSLTWFDQSGNGSNITPTLASQIPSFSSAINIGNVQSMIFDGAISGSVPKGFPLPNTITQAANNISAFGLFKAATGNNYSAIFQFNAGGTNPSLGVNAGGLFWNGTASGFAPTMNEAVGGVSSGPTSSNVYWGAKSATLSAASSTGLYTGWLGYIGDSGSRSGQFECGCFIVYASPLTQTQVQTLSVSIYNSFGVGPQARSTISFDGDSITQGALATLVQTYPRRAVAALNLPVNSYNMGIGGVTAAIRAANYSTSTAYNFNPYADNNILFFDCGTNDLLTTSAYTTYASITSYVTQAHATGFKVAVATILPRYDLTGANETQRQMLNTLILTNACGADTIADFAGDPVMGATGASANTALYGDGVHPSDLGNSYLSAIAADTVIKLYQY